MFSPCIKKCYLHKGTCEGCFRTIEEISNWRKYSLNQRAEILSNLQMRNNTHRCPSCGKPTYCAMEAGHSANTCWCMDVPIKEKSMEYSQCVCKDCLNRENDRYE